MGANSRMMRSRGKSKRRQQRLVWEVLSVFVIPLVHLCSFSPLVHAELIHQLPPRHPISVTAHCASPPLASQSTAPRTDHHKPTTEPVCCSLMGAQKGCVIRPVQMKLFPVLLPFQLPFDSGSSVWTVSHHGVSQMLPTMRNNSPLYLLHTLLLI
jgi:hypothetical protein